MIHKILLAVGTLVLIIAAVLIVRRLIILGTIPEPVQNTLDKIEQLTEEKNVKIGEDITGSLTLPEGFKIGVFGQGISGPRDLEFSPQGTLLVSNPGSGQVLALPDANEDGTADENKVIVTGLSRPHGLAFFNGKLYVAAENGVYRYSWDENKLEATLDRKLFDLPSGGNHRAYTIKFNKNGQMFVALGSTCNVCVEQNSWRATVITSNSEGESPQIYATGLRNAAFIMINPITDLLWGTEMGRDLLGDDVPPDEINIINGKSNYGWPYCYGNKIYDKQFGQKTPEVCTSTITPLFELQAHSAPLGLTFIDSDQFPNDWQGDLLVAFHGSWNRSVPTGYKVVHMKVKDNQITAQEDFLTGFLNGRDVTGRPVDVTFDTDGSLYVSDDQEGMVYKIIKK